MLDLTTTQAKLIKVFIEHYRDESGNISKGIPKSDLKKYDVDKNTFRKYEKYFTTSYILRLSVVKGAGNRPEDTYFQITHFGVMVYLKWQLKNNHLVYLESKKMNKNMGVSWDGSFFPFLAKHWSSIVQTYKQIFFETFDTTLNKIDIEYDINWKVGKKIFSGGSLTETIKIQTVNGITTIPKKYGEPIFQKIPKTNKPRFFITLENLNQEIDNKISERFTLFLLFNLLYVGTSALEISEYIIRCRVNYSELSKRKDHKNSKEDQEILDGI